LSTAFALGRVPMRAFAQKLAHSIKKGLPKDHWLLGDGTETVIALLADRVEKAGKASKSKGFEVTLEATSDFIEAFSQALCGEDDKDDAAKTGKKASATLPPPDSEPLKEVAVKDAEFVANVARVLLEPLPTAKELKEAGLTMEEFLAAKDKILAKLAEDWWNQKNLILYGPEKKPEPKVPGVPLKERFETAVKTVNASVGKFNAELAPHVARLQAATARLKQNQEQERARRTQAGFKERAWKQTKNILGWIFWK